MEQNKDIFPPEHHLSNEKLSFTHPLPQPTTSATFDVRMKRHPELQPYTPCARFEPIRKPTASTSTATSLTTSQSSNPKKFVSMTRLNQLAQPKKIRQPQQKQVIKNQTQQANTTSKPNSIRRISRQSLRESTPRRNDSTFDSSDKEQVITVAPIKNISPIRTSPPMPNGTFNLSDRNPDSLIRELKEDLLSKGLGSNDEPGPDVSPRVSTTTTTQDTNDEFVSFREQQSASTNMWAPDLSSADGFLERDSPDTSKTSGGKTNGLNNIDKQQEESIRRQREEEEENSRLKFEEQLREMARCEEEEREKRGKLVDSILSRISQGSP